MEDEQASYLLMVRAEPGVDSIRALRAWLKISLRTFGLKCVGIEQSNRRFAMDMRKYSAGVIMPEDLHDGPRTEKIINIFENEKHGCAVLEFESGDQLYLWNNNARILNKAWGYESADWLNQELELSLGHYTDKKSNTEKETIVVKPISPRKEKAGNGGKPPLPLSKTASSLKDDFADEVPF
jgi:hypothetical protein